MSEPWRHDLPHLADELARLARRLGPEEAEAVMRAKYDDDYTNEAHIDRKALEGWTRCEGCGDRIHLNDVREGASCSCEDE